MALLLFGLTNVNAQGTAFTYQGVLSVASVSGTNTAASGLFDFQFATFDDENSGSQIGPTQSIYALAVNNGHFTVTLDFGPGVFNSANRWLAIAVRPSGAGGFTTLLPRQMITPTPYAIYAANAGTATIVNGAELTNLPYAALSTTGQLAVTNAAQTVVGAAANIKLPPYNAAGDGVTDDSLAFFYVRTNPVIFIPSGFYITTNIYFSNNFRMFGEGPQKSVIKFKSGIYGAGDEWNGNYLFHARYASADISDIAFDGQHATSLAAAQVGSTNRSPRADNLERNGIALGTDNNATPRIERCEFRNFNGNAVYVRGADNQQASLKGKAIVINNTFTNNYTGVKTANGGTADYTQVIANRWSQNYIALNLQGGNVMVVGNQILNNYEAFYGNPTEGRWHNLIVGNTINHSAFASFFLDGCTVGAIISDNTIAGGGDIYFRNGTIQKMFRGNRFNGFNISAAPGTTNSFILNLYASGPPAIYGSGAVNQDNFSGTFTGSGSGLTSVPADSVAGGLTTNIAIAVPGSSANSISTNILYFTNGILRAVQ